MAVREAQTEHLTLALQQRITAHDLRIPVLPEIAWLIMRIANDPESNANQLVNLVQTEPVLAANVMRVANSAAFWRGTRLSSLPQAIARLGMTLVRDIAFATAINARIFDAAIYDRQIRQIGQHALATALWAKEIAQMTKRDAEKAFLCGLLHSIGKPVLLRATLDVDGLQPELIATDILMAHIDALHVDAAVVVLEHWNMPPTVIETVAAQQDTAACTRTEAHILRLAKRLASLTLSGDPLREAIAAHPALSALNIGDDRLEKLFARQGSVLATVEAIRG